VADQRRHAVVAQAAGVDRVGMKSWPSVCIFISGVIPAVSPKS
jgi:hypothetical protein